MSSCWQCKPENGLQILRIFAAAFVKSLTSLPQCLCTFLESLKLWTNVWSLELLMKMSKWQNALTPHFHMTTCLPLCKCNPDTDYQYLWQTQIHESIPQAARTGQNWGFCPPIIDALRGTQIVQPVRTYCFTIALTVHSNITGFSTYIQLSSRGKCRK
jgi:hypothetical protein